MTDDKFIEALDRLRQEFRDQNVQTEGAVNNGFIAIRGEMRSGLDRLTDQVAHATEAITARLVAHEAEDRMAEKRLASIESSRAFEAQERAHQELLSIERTRRQGTVAGLLAGFVVMGLGKFIDWLHP